MFERNHGGTFGPWLVVFSIGFVRVRDKLLSFSLGVSWIPSFKKKLVGYWITNQPTFGNPNETFSVGLGRPLDRLLFARVELRIGFGGLELENLRVVTRGTLATSSSEVEVESLSSSSALFRCVVRWIGCGATIGRV